MMNLPEEYEHGYARMKHVLGRLEEKKNSLLTVRYAMESAMDFRRKLINSSTANAGLLQALENYMGALIRSFEDECNKIIAEE